MKDVDDDSKRNKEAVKCYPAAYEWMSMNALKQIEKEKERNKRMKIGMAMKNWQCVVQSTSAFQKTTCTERNC